MKPLFILYNCIVAVIFIISAILYSITLLSIYIILAILGSIWDISSKRNQVSRNALKLAIFLIVVNFAVIITLGRVVDNWPHYVETWSHRPYNDDNSCDICGGQGISFEHLLSFTIYYVIIDGVKHEYCPIHFIVYIVTHMSISDLNMHYDIPRGIQLYSFILLQYMIYIMALFFPFLIAYSKRKGKSLAMAFLSTFTFFILWLMLLVPLSRLV